jgi:hypothetical protein
VRDKPGARVSLWANYRQYGSYRVTPGLRTNRKKSSYFLFADHPGVTRFSDSRTLDLLNERIVLISPIENLRSCLPVIVPERTGTKANSSRI